MSDPQIDRPPTVVPPVVLQPLPYPPSPRGNGSGFADARMQPHPNANPDTFTGLLARFDAYLSEMAKAEIALEEHADKLVAHDPHGPAPVPPQSAIGDDANKPVITRLQARLDRMSALTARIAQHHTRANKVF